MITEALQILLKGSNYKLNKIWANKCSYFYNKSIKLWLEDSNLKYYPTHVQEKSVVAERNNKTLKNEVYKQVPIIKKFKELAKNYNRLTNNYNEAC